MTSTYDTYVNWFACFNVHVNDILKVPDVSVVFIVL